MGVTKYKFMYNGVWKNFPNVESVCWELCCQLDNLNLLDLTTKGSFEPTIYLGKTYHKRYCVEVLFPYTKFIVARLDRGDMNQELFMKTLEKIKEIYESNKM